MKASSDAIRLERTEAFKAAHHIPIKEDVPDYLTPALRVYLETGIHAASGVRPVELERAHLERLVETKIVCPFMGPLTLSRALELLGSADTPLASVELLRALGNTGGGNLGNVLAFFAEGNHSYQLPLGPDQERKLVPAGLFNLELLGSQGAHHGNSGILHDDPRARGRGRLDLGRWSALVNDYSDPKTELIDIDRLGDFIADNLRSDPNAKVTNFKEMAIKTAASFREFTDVFLGGDDQRSKQATEAKAALAELLGTNNLMGSCGEWALMIAFLEHSPKSVKRVLRTVKVSTQDMKQMFVDKELPAGWETWEKSAATWVEATLKLTLDAGAALASKKIRSDETGATPTR